MKKITLLFTLLLSLNSFAAIIVKDIADHTFTTSAPSLNFDFNSDGTTEFTFNYNSSQGVHSIFYTNLDIKFVTVGTLSTGGWATMKSLPINTIISATSNFATQGDVYINQSGTAAANLFPAGDSYVGTTFKIGANRYYGWILVNSTGGASGVITVKSYAYNNVPDQQINAGQTILSNDKFSLVEYNVFPNPVNDNFTIESNTNTTEFKASIADINGKTINLRSNNNSFNISELSAGIYILKIEDSLGNFEIKKLIKQ